MSSSGPSSTACASCARAGAPRRSFFYKKARSAAMACGLRCAAASQSAFVRPIGGVAARTCGLGRGGCGGQANACFKNLGKLRVLPETAR
eukprot:8749910-Pyramimonas_sp.AAC.1